MKIEVVLSQSESVLSVIGSDIECSYFLFLLSEGLNPPFPLSSFSVPLLPPFSFILLGVPILLFFFFPLHHPPSIKPPFSSLSPPLTLSLCSLSSFACPPFRFGHQDSVSSIDCLSRERPVSAGMNDRTVRVWKVIEESQLVFHGHK